MPGPGGGGGGGGGGPGGGHGGGPGGGFGGPGGFRGGGPGMGGFRGPGGPPAPNMFFGGPVGPGRPVGPVRGPIGMPFCCWIILCTIAFAAIVWAGATRIEALDECTMDSSSGRNGNTVLSKCYWYMAALGVGVAVLCCCCCGCCIREGEKEWDGTPGERQPFLATEAQPQRVVYTS